MNPWLIFIIGLICGAWLLGLLFAVWNIRRYGIPHREDWADADDLASSKRHDNIAVKTDEGKDAA